MNRSLENIVCRWWSFREPVLSIPEGNIPQSLELHQHWFWKHSSCANRAICHCGCWAVPKKWSPEVGPDQTDTYHLCPINGIAREETGERINFMVVSPDAKKCILGKKKKCKAACLFPMAVLKLLPKIQLFSAKLASFMRTKFLLVHMWVADLFIWEGSVCVCVF